MNGSRERSPIHFVDWQTAVLPEVVYWQLQGFLPRIPAYQRYDLYNDPDACVVYYINRNIEILLALEHIFSVISEEGKVLLELTLRTAFFWLASQTSRPQLIRLTTLGEGQARRVIYRESSVGLKSTEQPDVFVEISRPKGCCGDTLTTFTTIAYPGEYLRESTDSYRLVRGNVEHGLTGRF
jgi:hypothetical protein